jgi:hypothetical protein
MALIRAAVLAVLLVSLTSSAFASDRLVTVDSPELSDLQAAAAAIKADGGYVKFVIPPHFIIADLPEGSEAGLVSSGVVSKVESGLVDSEAYAAFGPGARHVVSSWNNVFMGMARQAGLENEPAPDRQPLINDADLLDKIVLPLKPPGAKYYDVSEFMLGSVAVGVILPESNGTIDANTETWTQTEMDQVTSEIIAGLNWHVTKAEWRDLTFYTVFNYQVPTGYEPITRPSSDEALWINQCFTVMGYGNTSPGYPYVIALRDSIGADWGTCVFVVDSSVDADGMFTDGRFGYSYLGGPKITMTYDNDGWGIANMDAVLAHEISHSFYALDEYFDAGHGCTETAGYLAYQNQNSQYPYGGGGCAINQVNCIMRSVPLGTARVCNYTKGQLGWPDTDLDSIPDILDTYPETVLNAHAPDPDTVTYITYSGQADVTKLTNINPYGKGNEITLNRIAKVEFRVNGGAWQDAVPTDGVWDQGTELYSFVYGPLSTGPYVFETRAWHTYGNVDLTPAVDSVLIDHSSGVEPTATSAVLRVGNYPNPFGSKVEIRYSIPGEYGKAVPAAIRVYDVKGRQVATLLDEMRSPGPSKLTWDGAYLGGELAPSGIYFVELVAGDARVVSKLVLTR